MCDKTAIAFLLTCTIVFSVAFICMMKTVIKKEEIKIEMAKQGYEQVANPLNKYDPLWVKIK